MKITRKFFYSLRENTWFIIKLCKIQIINKELSKIDRLFYFSMYLRKTKDN